MRSTITRRYEIDCGHRVHNHEGKCARLHGHRYVVEATLSGRLDAIGRVVDFGVLKTHLSEILDPWDHRMLLYRADPTARAIMAGEAIPGIDANEIVITAFNPTAENMADFILKELTRRLLHEFDVEVESVKVGETPNCSAVAHV